MNNAPLMILQAAHSHQTHSTNNGYREDHAWYCLACRCADLTNALNMKAKRMPPYTHKTACVAKNRMNHRTLCTPTCAKESPGLAVRNRTVCNRSCTKELVYALIRSDVSAWHFSPGKNRGFCGLASPSSRLIVTAEVLP